MARPTAKYAITAEDRTKAGLSSVERGLGSLRRQFGALGAALSVGAFVGVTKQAFTAADEINKLSTQLGFSTEALSQYGFVAQQTGVNFNALTTGLQRATRRINEAAQGTGEAKNALFELGVDAQRLARLRPEQQFEVLADAFARVEDQGTKVRLAFKLFDTEGVKLLRTMEGGSEAIRGLRGEADALGLTLDQNTADAATRTRDALGRLRAQFSASGDDIVRIFGPAIEGAANWLSETIPKAVLQAERFLVRARQGFTTLAAGLASLFGADEVASNLRDLSDVYAEEFDNLGNTVESFAVELGDAVNAADFFDDSLKSLATTTTKNTSAQKALNAELARAKDITEGVRTPLESYRDSLADLNDLFNRGRISQQTFTRATAAAPAEFLQGLNIDQTPLQNYTTELYRLEEALAQSVITFDEYSRARFALEEGLEGQVDKTKEKVEETENALTEFAKGAAQNAQSALSEFFFDPFNSDLDGLVSNFATAMRRIAAEAASSAVFDSFSGASGGLGGILAGLFAGKASGGPVPGRTPILVGERGPEIFVPNRGGGNIVPNGGVGSTVNVNVTASSSLNRDSAMQVGYDIGRQIQESMRRNG